MRADRWLPEGKGVRRRNKYMKEIKEYGLSGAQ